MSENSNIKNDIEGFGFANSQLREEKVDLSTNVHDGRFLYMTEVQFINVKACYNNLLVVVADGKLSGNEMAKYAVKKSHSLLIDGFEAEELRVDSTLAMIAIDKECRNMSALYRIIGDKPSADEALAVTKLRRLFLETAITFKDMVDLLGGIDIESVHNDKHELSKLFFALMYCFQYNNLEKLSDVIVSDLGAGLILDLINS